MKESALQIARRGYAPKMPLALRGETCLKEGAKTQSVADQDAIKALFPNTYGLPVVEIKARQDTKTCCGKKTEALNVGVILSGGQAPGGHNVISGLYDGLKRANKDSKLYGFTGGPSGLIDGKYIELTAEIIDQYRNTGGFDIIGSGRTKLEETWQFDKGIEVCKQLGITAIVIIGGDDSNTNACVLAEYYLQKQSGIQVIGCPKTIDGDLKNNMIETSFGFDTACKVYSELIGNIQRDANSAKKYWHFIRLMGRSASHIALECGLQTQPNMTIISEEVEAKQMTLSEIVEDIAQVVAARASKGLNFGTVLVPEGLIEFIPAMRALIQELNDLLADGKEFDVKGLSASSRQLYESLPAAIAKQLTMDRDPHGNVQVSLIETEKLLIEMVSKRLSEMKGAGQYAGKFATQHHFFGYEGRCAVPSNFDADYCYSLGQTAAKLIQAGKTGYMATVRDLTKPASEWTAGGVPITMMMNMERRNGKMKPVIQKALVDLQGKPYQYLAAHREEWALSTETYIFPGPIQYYGPSEVCDQPTVTLRLEHE